MHTGDRTPTTSWQDRRASHREAEGTQDKGTCRLTKDLGTNRAQIDMARPRGGEEGGAQGRSAGMGGGVSGMI